jgi:hypothetical protein
MSKQTFFPFRVSPGALTLQVSVVGPEGPSAPQEQIKAYQIDSNTIDLAISVKVDESIYTKTLASAEQAAKPTRLLLLLRGSRSRMRKRIPLLPIGTTRISLKKEEWIGTVEAQAVLVRATSNPTLPPGFARDQGALLADSKIVEILFDEPVAPPVGGLINLKWENFAESQQEFLKSQPENLFALDDVADPPVLYLNSGLEGATATLSSKATHGPVARLRDAYYATITHQVWSSLLTTALIALADRLAETEPEDALAELLVWQRAAIVEWAPRFYPALIKPDAMAALCDVLKRRSWEREILLRRLPEAIQRFVGTGKSFAKVAKEV